jgi:nicotinate-nucleotide adenylyltransferase
MQIGLMGGTFDPIHYGHLFIAEAARVQCELDHVLFFPNNQPAPVLNKAQPTDGETRLHLVEVAIARNEYFQSSRIELDRPGPSYAIDTVLQLQHENPDAQLHYIVGADSIEQVLTWHRGAELFDHCHFIAATRPGFDFAKAKEELTPEQLEKVIFLELPGLHIASRELRNRVQQNLPIRYLVPDEVHRAINSLNLYRD